MPAESPLLRAIESVPPVAAEPALSAFESAVDASSPALSALLRATLSVPPVAALPALTAFESATEILTESLIALESATLARVAALTACDDATDAPMSTTNAAATDSAFESAILVLPDTLIALLSATLVMSESETALLSATDARPDALSAFESAVDAATDDPPPSPSAAAMSSVVKRFGSRGDRSFGASCRATNACEDVREDAIYLRPYRRRRFALPASIVFAE